MADKEQLEILKRGTAVWNEWRIENPTIKPNLGRAELRYAELNGVNLTHAYLWDADLSRAHLRRANFGSADLREANISRADLTFANLLYSNLGFSNLTYANLTGTSLKWANFGSAILDGMDISDSTIGWTTFGNNDLSLVNGLETIEHHGPSTIGIDTIFRSKGSIPKAFLRGAGVTDNFIDYMTSLAGNAFEFYSCFISYSSKNQAFAERLYMGLQNKGIRCWFAPEDLKIGDKTRVVIDESIRKHDKLLLVLSRYSMESEWVEKEVETALERERREKRIVLFPIRLDDSVMRIENGWPADIRRTRNIGDFKKWKNHDVYQKAFDKLLRDLKASDQGRA